LLLVDEVDVPDVVVLEALDEPTVIELPVDPDVPEPPVEPADD
jgi:hypothetical protein